MPLFDFRCAACGHEFEALVRPADPERTCPQCGSGPVEKLLSLFAVSSDASRQANLDAARKMARGIARDRTIAEQEVAARHAHDDH